ncbi:ribonuclease HI [Trichuris suis]|nr:ribonuclease HI [Trichuris suis]
MRQVNVICRFECTDCLKVCDVSRLLGVKLFRCAPFCMQRLANGISSAVARYLRHRIMAGFYAVRRGRRIGIFNTWDECRVHVHQFSGAEFKKFKTLAEAQNFLTAKPLTDRFPNVIPSVPPASTKTGGLARIRALLAKARAQGAFPTGIQSAQPLTTGTQNGNIPSTEAAPPADVPPVPSVGVKRKYTKRAVRKSTSSVKVKKRKRKVGAKALRSISGLGTKRRGSYRRIRKRRSESSYVCKEGYTVCYTDGACVANGRRKAKAGFGVYWGANDPRNVSERLAGLQTNNRAEIEACCRAIEQAKLSGIQKLEIRTDSRYVINCVTKWIHQWRRNNWTSAHGHPVKNKADLTRLAALSESISVNWVHVAGHAGITGNEEADRLAREAALTRRFLTPPSFRSRTSLACCVTTSQERELQFGWLQGSLPVAHKQRESQLIF